jgi:hypothetical protein
MPDTAAYYHVAYVVVALLYGGYAATLWLRARAVRDQLRRSAAGADDAR